ncbi:hypothetical protein BKA62DRAFT_696202 [Auriculariales sp. MPI-PUGE-AT-0066]|nr:hypothetical protein BKA62DRAFT_696202 [Auriculariales sp. MPI-PUGE-AT-0066]
MSYDSTAYNANPNNTQLPARHDDLPAPVGNNQPFMPMETRRYGEADYPYVDGGERPLAAGMQPGMPAADRVKTGTTGTGPAEVLDSNSGSDTYGASGTGKASAGDGPAARIRGGSEHYAEQGLRSNEPAMAPVHRLHSQNEPLPPPRDTYIDFDGVPTADAPPTHRLHSDNEALPLPPDQQQQQGPRFTDNTAYTQERPLGVQPVREGGVAIDGREGLPEGRSTMMDKLAGKTQKVVGKMTNNSEMHERGDLREAGGKADRSR